MSEDKLIQDNCVDTNVSDQDTSGKTEHHSEHSEHREHSHHHGHSHHGEHSHHGHSHRHSHSHSEEHSDHHTHSHSDGHSHRSHHSHSSSHHSEHHHERKYHRDDYPYARSSHSDGSLMRKIKNRIKKMFDTNAKKKKASTICAIALVIVLFFAITVELIEDIRPNFWDKNLVGHANPSDSEIVEIELVNAEGVLVSGAVVNFLKVDLSSNRDAKLNDYLISSERVDAQKPVGIHISTNKSKASYYKIELADNIQFENARVDYLHAESGTYTFEHLYVNTEYYYRVTAYTAKGTFSEIGQFTTADTPRILSIEGAYNVRDIGNWQTDSGKRIKQGLLIRGTEIDGAVESGYHITSKGLDDLLYVYGIKMDLDLRNEEAIKKYDDNGELISRGMDALGSSVEHKYYNSPMYTNIFDNENGEMARVGAIFKDIANPANYPMYLHCTYGKDRTGTVCFILEAVLGVSESDCLKDYALTRGTDVNDIIAVSNGLKQYDTTGTMTLKEMAEAYLLDCGLTPSEINTIRAIFLGE